MLGKKITWPEGKDFAFTIFDDTDYATLANVGAVYSLLVDHGFKTTKSVWPLQSIGYPPSGSTCEDNKYLSWLYDLKEKDFEIALHTVSMHSSMREETIRGIEKFFELFGHYPKSMANHDGCLEDIYWGAQRLTGMNRLLYKLLTINLKRKIYEGEIKGSKYFWGDICKEKIRFVRSFVFPEINTLKACPMMPYHDEKKPYVNYWFASSEGPRIDPFNQCISEKNQDSLEEEGGACIMYTHFSRGFIDKNELNPRFKFLMKRLSKKNGWFVPVSTLLEYLLEKKDSQKLLPRERRQLERKWLLHKIKVGRT